MNKDGGEHIRWKPDRYQAAVCFTMDDVHPGTSADAYEAGGDGPNGVLGHLQWLLGRHPQLRATLFVTPDWRELSPAPTRTLLSKIPWLRDRVYNAPVRRRGAMRIGRHPAFVNFLKSLDRVEIAPHGFEHIARGLRIPAEFAGLSEAQCEWRLAEALRAFEEADLPIVRGFTPPTFEASPQLLNALITLGFAFVASARDIVTPISPKAATNMSGLKGVSLLEPQPICDNRLLHIPTNFQATSDLQRALDIVESGGLLSIKAHAIKNAMGHIALDGLDLLYRNYLDVLFSVLEEKFGDAIWWTSMGGITHFVCSQMADAPEGSSPPLISA